MRITFTYNADIIENNINPLVGTIQDTDNAIPNLSNAKEIMFM